MVKSSSLCPHPSNLPHPLPTYCISLLLRARTHPHWHLQTPRTRTLHHTLMRYLKSAIQTPGVREARPWVTCCRHSSTELEKGMRREFAAVLPHHNPRCSKGSHVRHRLILVANGTSMVPRRSPLAASRGKEVMCSEPRDTSSVEGSGGGPAANEAANGVMLSGIIRSVNSSCRLKSHLTELGELPRQLLPPKAFQ